MPGPRGVAWVRACSGSRGRAGTARGPDRASSGSLVSSKSPPGPGPWFLSVLCSSGPWERVCEGVRGECPPMSAPARTERGNAHWDSASSRCELSGPSEVGAPCPRPCLGVPQVSRRSPRQCPRKPQELCLGNGREKCEATRRVLATQPDGPPRTSLTPGASSSTPTQGLAFSLPVPGLPVGGDGGTAERRGRPVAGSETSLQRDRGRGPCFPSASPYGFKMLHLNLLVK